MLLIEIDEIKIDEKKGTSSTGNPYHIRNQIVYVHQPDKKYPFEAKVRLGDNQEPYPVGSYNLSPESFYSGQFGSIGFNPVLTKADKK